MKEKLIHFNKINILDAAETLFAKKGIVQTTMDDIVKGKNLSEELLLH